MGKNIYIEKKKILTSRQGINIVSVESVFELLNETPCEMCLDV